MASFLQDFIFFGIIGFASLFVTLARPEDEAYRSRIRALANSDNVSENAKKFLEAETKKNLAYNQESKVDLRIKEYDKKHKALKISTEINNQVKNMCKDITHTMIDTEAFVYPDIEIDGLSGVVEHLSLTTNGKKGKHIPKIEAYSVYLKGTDRFEDVISDFEVNPGGIGHWKFCYWIWSLVENDKSKDPWYFIKWRRYTDSLILEISNETNKKINFDYRYTNRSPSEVNRKAKPEIAKNGVSLAPGGTYKICDREILHDNDIVQLFFNSVK